MKKFNKFLAFGLAGASVLTGGFMLSGCDVTEDKDKTQNQQTQEENKVVGGISINADSLPSYIIKGHFARTNITMTVMYEDGSTKIVDVLESMFSETDKEKLKNVGQYNLTVNYGDKTATMYANVVDERYLLKEVVEANIDKDMTVTSSEGTMKYDAENKILHYTDDEDYTFWGWINNNFFYTNESDDDGSNKWLSGTIYDYINDEYPYSKVVDMFKRTDAWIIDDIEKDGLNYILTATHGDDEQYKYYFNEDFMYKLEETDGGYVYTSTYNYSIVNLEVPAEIKALESSVTVDVESITWDLKDLMEDYLESNFEMVATGDYGVTQKYDANNKIMYESYQDWHHWSWVNGDYRYSYESDNGDSVWKYDASTWMDRVKETMFMEEVLDNGNYSSINVDISSDGQYYILTAVSNPEIETGTYIYKFNNDEIIGLTIEDEEDGDSITIDCAYTKKSINLEVPSEIKALESSAQ